MPRLKVTSQDNNCHWWTNRRRSYQEDW